MTEPHGPDADDERRVADFLADLGDVPIPDEVVARLDTTLERLVAARSQETNVVALRPRRRWATALVAAATVSVVGVGVGAVWQQSDHGSDAMNAEDSGKTAPEFTALDSASPLASGSVFPMPTGSDALGEGYFAGGASSVPAFTGAGFPDEVRAFLQARDTDSAGQDQSACPAPVPAGGTAHAATYEGAEAVLVVGPVDGGEQRVQIFRCGGDDTPLASTVVPAP